MSKKIFGIKTDGETVISRIDTEAKTMEFSLDGTNWTPLSLALATGETSGAISEEEKAKLAALIVGYKGYYGTVSALSAAHSTGVNGDFAFVEETGTIWRWKGTLAVPAWVNSVPSKSVQIYIGSVSDAGVITLENNTPVSAMAIGDMVRFSAENSALGIAAGELWQKRKDSIVIGTDPTRLNVTGTFMNTGPYIHWNPYVIHQAYPQTGSGRRWFSSNSTYWVQYGAVAGYSGRWIVHYIGIVYAYADDDGSHDPWDASLTWVTTDKSGSVNIGVEIYSYVSTDTIQLFSKILSFADIATVISSEQTGSVSLSVDSAGRMMVMSGTSETTVTIPAEIDSALPVGTWCIVLNTSSKKCTVTGSSEVMLNGITGGKSKIAPMGDCMLRKTASNAWLASRVSSDVVSDETTVTTSYAADYNSADIHMIKTTASTACALSVSNLAKGEALIVCVDNAAAGSVIYNATEILASTETGISFLKFICLDGENIRFVG